MSEQLAQLFSDPAIRELGNVLRKSLRENNDYASLIDLDYAETVADLAEALKKLLRRYDSFAARKKWSWRPSTASYEKAMSLAGHDKDTVRMVRAALISHALTFSPFQPEAQKEE